MMTCAELREAEGRKRHRIDEHTDAKVGSAGGAREDGEEEEDGTVEEDEGGTEDFDAESQTDAEKVCDNDSNVD